ncbi:MAG: hypothetical protein R2867_03535 [Caldilineaceae bacterium]
MPGCKPKRALGFVGAGCLHPRVPVVHRALAPTAEEVAKARRIVAGFQAQSQGRAVANVDGLMVDAPVAERAQRILTDGVAAMNRLNENAAGRLVPTTVNGRTLPPYQGVGGSIPTGRKHAPPLRSCAHYPAGSKLCAKSGGGVGTGRPARWHDPLFPITTSAMVIYSWHKSLLLPRIGVRDQLAAVGHLSRHAPFADYLENGLIHHIEGSLTAALCASLGKMQGLRSYVPTVVIA